MGDYDISVSSGYKQCNAVDGMSFAQIKQFYTGLLSIDKDNRLTENQHLTLNESLQCLLENESIVDALKDKIISYLIHVIRTNSRDPYAQMNKEILVSFVGNNIKIFGATGYDKIQKQLNLNKQSKPEIEKNNEAVKHPAQQQDETAKLKLSIADKMSKHKSLDLKEKEYVIANKLQHISSPPTKEQQKYLQAVLRGSEAGLKKEIIAMIGNILPQFLEDTSTLSDATKGAILSYHAYLLSIAEDGKALEIAITKLNELAKSLGIQDKDVQEKIKQSIIETKIIEKLRKMAGFIKNPDSIIAGWTLLLEGSYDDDQFVGRFIGVLKRTKDALKDTTQLRKEVSKQAVIIEEAAQEEAQKAPENPQAQEMQKGVEKNIKESASGKTAAQHLAEAQEYEKKIDQQFNEAISNLRVVLEHIRSTDPDALAEEAEFNSPNYREEISFALAQEKMKEQMKESVKAAEHHERKKAEEAEKAAERRRDEIQEHHLSHKDLQDLASLDDKPLSPSVQAKVDEFRKILEACPDEETFMQVYNKTMNSDLMKKLKRLNNPLFAIAATFDKIMLERYDDFINRRYPTIS